ncbi:peptide-methionine (S)-S-oxide reductase MsrA [Singulisphaera sp. PoT]|uniref:peptide-methionine (S)-S-oxide reductase MsrA n=1 Tax=Singulisphaera sp. PoT TaxID=3411797 RepID=UPI003BF5075A
MRLRSLLVMPWVAAVLIVAGAVGAQEPAGSPKTSNTGENPSQASEPGDASEKSTTPAKEMEKEKADEGEGKSEKDKEAKPKKAKVERATFAGGCFWSIEAIFERIPGVKSAVSGFAGGVVPSPDYDTVCTGETGHAESVRVTYDPDVVSYEDLLEVFWAAHDPTTLNAQGEDFGTQYRSVIFFHSEEQRKAALKSYRQLTDAGVFGRPIVTDLVPMNAFYPAERYHQDYYRNHRTNEYCQRVIAPKLRKLKLIK